MMATQSPRIAPLEPPYGAEAAAELEQWMPPGMEPLSLFRTLAVNVPLAEAMRPLGRHLLGRQSGIDLLAREVVINRVCARQRCDYEWGVHAAVFGSSAGLTPQQVADTAATDVDPALWRKRERALLVMVDQLCARGHVDDHTWQALSSHFDEAQLLTLLLLTGWYCAISFVANGARVPVEPWASRLPAPDSGRP